MGSIRTEEGIFLRKVMLYMYNVWSGPECDEVCRRFEAPCPSGHVWDKWVESRYDAMRFLGEMQFLIDPVCQRAKECYDDDFNRIRK
ncbi:MAG: hypothetical protein EOM65_04825 [Synergistales bacterium]|nr:hypothetical protein [Synergistales bacterium]